MMTSVGTGAMKQWVSHLQHQHPKWAPIQVPVAPILIQFSDNMAEKAVKNGPNTWVPELTL